MKLRSRCSRLPRAGRLALVLTIAGCSAAPASSDRAKLSASSEVTSYGISAYEIGGGGANLYSSAGAFLGSITVEPGTSAGPRIHMDLADGTYWDTAFEKHSDVGYPMSLENNNVMTAVELDPALAPLWATVGIRYSRSALPERRGEALSAASYEACIAPHNPVCRAFDCRVSYDIPFFQQIGSTQLNPCTPAACSSSCAGSFVYDGPVEARCDTSQGSCECYSHKVKTTSLVSCPRLRCANTSDCDLLHLVRDCIDPGPSCSNTGTGFRGCTDRFDSNRTCGSLL